MRPSSRQRARAVPRASRVLDRHDFVDEPPVEDQRDESGADAWIPCGREGLSESTRRSRGSTVTMRMSALRSFRNPPAPVSGAARADPPRTKTSSSPSCRHQISVRSSCGASATLAGFVNWPAEHRPEMLGAQRISFAAPDRAPSCPAVAGSEHFRAEAPPGSGRARATSVSGIVHDEARSRARRPRRGEAMPC